MRTPNVALFHETVALCFDEVLGWLGEVTRRVLYDLLLKRGITRGDISTRFREVEEALIQFSGASARSVLVGTLRKVCDEYSLPLNLNYSDSLEGRLAQLRDQIIVQKAVPKHYRSRIDTLSFEDKHGTIAPWSD